MEIIDKLDKLMLSAEDSERVRVGEIITTLTDYVMFVAEEEMKAHIHSKKNKNTEKEIEEKYEECVSEIKALNNMSSKLLGQKIYNQEFERNKVEDFLQKLLSEIFENRKISRK